MELLVNSFAEATDPDFDGGGVDDDESDTVRG